MSLSAPALDVRLELDHELNRKHRACGALTHSDSVGLIRVGDWSDTRSVNIVFVHGLGGHPYSSWQSNNDNCSFWPLWLLEDIPGCAVFTFGYDSPPTNWLGTALPLLDESVSASDHFAREPELQKAPLVFICHSMGGLIVKQVLRDANERKNVDPALCALLTHTRAVVFIATPHTGSGKASLLERLSAWTLISSSAKSLVANSPELRNLNTGYRTLADERKAELSHLAFFEMESTPLGMIVDPGASDPGLVGCRPIPIKADHLAICKPEHRHSQVYAATLALIRGITPSASPAGTLRPAQLPTYKNKQSFRYLFGAAIRAAILFLALFLVWKS